MKISCCNRFMGMLRAAYDMATHAIKGVQLGNDPEIKYPDGAGIVKLTVPDAQTLDEIEAYIEVSKATDERLSLDIERLDTAKQDKLIAGANITISDDNVISATGGGGGGSGSDFTAQNNDGSMMFFKNGVKQAELTEGANITISADGVISATGGSTGGTPTADEVLLTDGRSVQDGIDSIEDELGDLGTSGTVQSRLEALETADIELSKAFNSFDIVKATKGKVSLSMSAVDGSTAVTEDILTAGLGLQIQNGVIRTVSDTTQYTELSDFALALNNYLRIAGGSIKFETASENVKLTNFDIGRANLTFSDDLQTTYYVFVGSAVGGSYNADVCYCGTVSLTLYVTGANVIDRVYISMGGVTSEGAVKRLEGSIRKVTGLSVTNLRMYG